MKQILYFFILSFLICSCETKELKNEEEVINDILLSIIEDNPKLFLASCPLLDKFSDRLAPPSENIVVDSAFKETISKFFDKKEIESITEQKKNVEEFGIVTNNLKARYRLLDKTKLDKLIKDVEKSFETESPLSYWEEFDKRIGCIQGFSRPLISLDKKTAIIRHYEILGGKAGGGFTKVFKLINEKWTEIEELEYWIS